MGVLLVAGSGSAHLGETLDSLWWLTYWQERDDNLCGEIGTSCNSSDWNTTCWPRVRWWSSGVQKKSLDLPWVKSPEASGNTGDYPTSKTENSHSTIFWKKNPLKFSAGQSFEKRSQEISHWTIFWEKRLKIKTMKRGYKPSFPF